MSTQPRIPSVDVLYGPPPTPAAPSGRAIPSVDILYGGGAPTVASLGLPRGFGERLYQTAPQAIVQAIRAAEGVPSYGNMALAKRYGTHERVPEEEGRRATARLVHLRFREWVQQGRPGDFLDYLRDRYAPVGAANDPTNLNVNWLPNVVRHLPAPPPSTGAAPPPAAPSTRAQIEQEARIQELRRHQEVYVPGVGWVLRPNAEQMLGPDAVTKLPSRTARPAPAVARGFTRGFLAPLPVQSAAPEGRPSRAARIGEAVGEFGGFVLSPAARILGWIGQPLTKRLGAAAARTVGPQVAHHLGRIAGITTEGAIYGVADYLTRDWDRFTRLARERPKDAAQILGTAAGLTAAEFAAFGAIFDGLVGLVRRGILTRQSLDAVSEGIRDLVRGRPDIPEFAPTPTWRGDVAQAEAQARAAMQALEAVQRRARAGRVLLTTERGVELAPPAPERIGELGLTERPGVIPVERAPVRETVPTRAALREAEAIREEDLQRRLSQVRAAGGLLVPPPRPQRPALIVPGQPPAERPPLVVPGRISQPREILRGRPQLTDGEVRELEGYGWTRDQIASMTPAQAERALADGRLRVVPPAEPAAPSVRVTAPAEPPAAPRAARPGEFDVQRLQIGDRVRYQGDGELYRVVNVGPRGYSIVDVATGMKRRSIARDDAARQLLPPLVEAAPAPSAEPPALALQGEAVPAPAPEVGVQQRLIGAVRPEFGELPAPEQARRELLAAQGKTIGPGELFERGAAAGAEPQQRLAAAPAAEQVAPRTRARPPRPKRVKTHTEMTIGQFARSVGISIEKSGDVVGELRALQREGRVPPGLFRKAGRGVDDLAKTMQELGFRGPDGEEMTADVLIESLKAEYGKQLPKERFLHPAAEAHVEAVERDFEAAQFRHYAEQEGLATAVIERYLTLQPKERGLVDQAFRRAFESVGEVRTAKDVHRLVAEAARLYNTELLPALLRVPAAKVPADRRLTPGFFLDMLPTRVDPGSLPKLPTRRKGGLPYAETLGGGGSALGGYPSMAEILLSPSAVRRLRAFRQRLMAGRAAYTAEEVQSQARRVLREGRARETARQTPLEYEGHPQAAMAEGARIPASPRTLPPAGKDVGATSMVLTPRHVFHKMGPTGETIYSSMIFAWDTFSKRYEAFLMRMGDIQRALGMRHWTPRRNRRIARRLFHAIDDPEAFAAAVATGATPRLTTTEQKAVNEIKAMLDWYADRIDMARAELGMAPINRRKAYVTHLINDTVRFMLESQRGIPEDMAKAMRFSLPGEIFHPFLLQRRANLPVVEDVFAALRAYVRVTEKMLAFNPVLPVVRQQIEALPPAAQEYAEWWVRTTLGQPGTWSNLIDNTAQRMAGVVGYKRVRLPGAVAKALDLPPARPGSPRTELMDDLEAVDVLVPRLYNLFRRGVSRRATTAIKRLNYWSFIGLNIKVGLVNLTQTISTAARLRGWPHQVVGDMLAGYGRVLVDIWRPSRWRYWKDRGVLSEMEKLMDEELAAGQGLLGDLLMFNMKLTEFINRVSTTVAKTRELGRVEGVFGDEATRLAKEFSDFVNFRYGGPFTPRLYHSAGPLGPLGSLLYSYGTFPANQMYVVAQMAEKARLKALLPDAFRAMARGASAFGEYMGSLAAGERGELLRYLLYGYVTFQLLSPLGLQFWDTFAKGIVNAQIEGASEFIAGFFTGDRNRMMRGAFRFATPPALSRGVQGLVPGKVQFDRIRRAMQQYESREITGWDAFLQIVAGWRP